jgi:lambda repressor-like predicted transcriptional regulator
MEGLTVEVRSRVVGGRGGDPEIEPVYIRLLEEKLTVAELIRRTVEEQVRDLVARRKLDAEQTRRALDRQYHSGEEIIAKAEHSTVKNPSRRATDPVKKRSAAEVRKALSAFDSRSYYVTVDGRQVERLDDVIELRPDSKVTFIRLMPLVGGAG